MYMSLTSYRYWRYQCALNDVLVGWSEAEPESSSLFWHMQLSAFARPGKLLVTASTSEIWVIFINFSGNATFFINFYGGLSCGFAIMHSKASFPCFVWPIRTGVLLPFDVVSLYHTSGLVHVISPVLITVVFGWRSVFLLQSVPNLSLSSAGHSAGPWRGCGPSVSELRGCWGNSSLP